MEAETKIVAFPGQEPLPENPLTIEEPKHRVYCSHESVSLDEHLRVVNCRQCGAVLDAFSFLRNNARTVQMAWRNHRMVTNKVAELQERIEVLERERKRLSAQVKRLQEKAPSLDVRGKDRL
jgi:uncharacterized small protein (DUF1192 family)